MSATPRTTSQETTTGPTRALRLISFVYMLASLALALLSLVGVGASATTGALLTTLFVAGQGVLIWSLCSVLCAIADDIHSYISRHL